MRSGVGQTILARPILGQSGSFPGHGAAFSTKLGETNELSRAAAQNTPLPDLMESPAASASNVGA